MHLTGQSLGQHDIDAFESFNQAPIWTTPLQAMLDIEIAKVCRNCCYAEQNLLLSRLMMATRAVSGSCRIATLK